MNSNQDVKTSMTVTKISVYQFLIIMDDVACIVEVMMLILDIYVLNNYNTLVIRYEYEFI